MGSHDARSHDLIFMACISYHPIIFIIINLLLIAMATQQELAMPDSDRSFSIVAFLTGVGESKLSGNSDDDLSSVSRFCFFLFEDQLMLNTPKIVRIQSTISN